MANGRTQEPLSATRLEIVQKLKPSLKIELVEKLTLSGEESFEIWLNHGRKAGKDYTDFDHCFDFSRFNYPEELDLGLLQVLCRFIEISGVTYVHRSDVRKEGSTHDDGSALDFHFKVPHDQDPVLYFREQLIALRYYIIANQFFTMGIGLYFWGGDDWSLHLDTGRLNGQWLKPLRRWYKERGKKAVAFGVGFEVLREQARQRL